jgi:hypothetical protein
MRILIKRVEPGRAHWAAFEPIGYTTEDEFQAMLNHGSVDLIPPAPGDTHTVFAREVATDSGPIDLIGVGSTGSITIMECKLAKNSDSKRKVVGQILDYAAALWETDLDAFAAAFKVKSEGRLDPFEALRRRHFADGSAWDQEETCRAEVARRLETGDFRLVIAVDSIDPELRRIIQFVNTRGSGGTHLHLVALAFPRFELDGTEIVVPEAFGDEIAPPPSPHEKSQVWDWTPEEFALSARPFGSEAEGNVRAALEWMRRRGITPVFGKGRTGPMYLVLTDASGTSHKVVKFYPDGMANISYDVLRQAPPFDQGHLLLELVRRLNAVPGVTVSETAISGESSYIKQDVLANGAGRQTFFDLIDWVAERLAIATPT